MYSAEETPSVDLATEQIVARGDLIALENERSRIFTVVQHIVERFKNISPQNVLIYQSSMDRLETHAKDFDRVQKEISILNINFPPEERFDVNERQLDFEDLVHEAQALYWSNHPSTRAAQNSTVASHPPQLSPVRLPRLELPRFSGKLAEWSSFYNLFKVAIHDPPSLSPVEKFQYLLTQLEGEALDQIKNLQLTPENYEAAWQILTAHYQNERRHTMYHLFSLIDLPDLTASNLTYFLSKLQEHVHALEALNHKLESFALLLMALTLKKFNAYHKKRFDDSRPDKQSVPTLLEVVRYLESEVCQISENEFYNRASSRQVIPKPLPPTRVLHADSPDLQNALVTSARPGRSVQRTPVTSPPLSPVSCRWCDGAHSLFQCKRFLDLPGPTRRDAVVQRKLCFNCLSPSHLAKDCTSQNSCRHCQQKHHSLLHLFLDATQANAMTVQVEPTEYETNIEYVDQAPATALLGSAPLPNRLTLLPTVRAIVTSLDGRAVVLRAVIDSGAENCFITNSCANLLKLRVRQTVTNVSGLSGNAVHVLGTTNASIYTANKELVTKNHPMFVVQKITGYLPSAPLHPKLVDFVQNYPLSDPEFHIPGPIDLLISADLIGKVINGVPIILDPPLTTCLLSTVFGYAVVGESFTQRSTYSVSSPPRSSSTLLCNTQELRDSIERFWKIEDANPPPSKTNPDDEHAEKIYSTTTIQQPNGRYQVRLPFREHAPCLGESFLRAEKRFFRLESQLQSNPKLKDLYVRFINDYLKNGFMKEIDPPPPDSRHYYIPHRGVLNESSTTTKLRVCVDASAPTTNGLSLNDILVAGPKLQKEIPDILLNFRRHPVVFSGDVKQMFLQIDLHPLDHPYQLILWREDPSHPLKVFALTTVTFGVNCSPFLAIRTIQQTARDHGHLYPKAAEILLRDIYVDNVVSGADSADEVKHLLRDLNALAAKGGFFLRKWTCSDPSVLSDYPPDELEPPLFDDNANPKYSVLGLSWLSSKDSFTYKIKTPPPDMTKRTILALIASIFDPCGWITPVSFKAKAFMQQLWLLKIGWDDPLPTPLADKWNGFLSDLPVLKDLLVPRRINAGGKKVQLHGFCDASEAGYAAVLYLRTTPNPPPLQSDPPPLATVTLIAAKSRVAPLKTVSLPRLELCAASLLASLLKRFTPVLTDSFEIEKTYLWSDSTVTLVWIQTPPYHLKTFISNRVAEIQEATSDVIWRHIRSSDNPADCASRGLKPGEILNHTLWWNGPTWLQTPLEHWPESIPVLPSKGIPELKQGFGLSVLTAVQSEQFQLPVFADWEKLVRVVAYVARFGSRPLKKGVLSLQEIYAAEHRILKFIQSQTYKEELESLQRNRPCSPQIQRLTPFLDDAGLLRVGGRLRNASLPQFARTPILLPSRHPLVKLLVVKYHTFNLHAATKLLQALLARRYWITAVHTLARRVVHECIPCFKTKPRTNPPLMGDLPSPRVQPNPVFTHSGMDFAGPFKTKIHQLRFARIVPVYICIFVCMSTRAVHIEVVHDLTTPAYIAALHRFSARRGLPAHVYCDQGSNFGGAHNHFKRLLMNTNEELLQYANARRINFHFNPPYAPHQGGLWEAAVKSVKSHISRTIGLTVLLLEEFQTLCVRIEAMLNSRPLTPLSPDPNDFTPLTPGHFLIGRPLVAPQEEIHDLERLPLLRRWKLVEALFQTIWNRWHKEYLNTLQIRGKWTKVVPPLQVGTLVLMGEPNAPPLAWKTGRVIKVHPGADGQVRVARVRTATSELERPVHKLFPLPLTDWNAPTAGGIS